MTGPGSLVLIGRIALNRWVPTVAPASIAALVCVVRRFGVADGGHHARFDDLPDRGKGAVAFRRDGDHADGTPARFENAVDLGGIGIPHQAPADGRRTAAWTATDLPDEFRRAIRHERRRPGRRPDAAGPPVLR